MDKANDKINKIYIFKMKKPPHPITIEYTNRYKKLKIEKLGDTALSIVLNGVRKGRSYREIAKMLEESFCAGTNKKITHKDVSAVMNANAEIMAEYQKFLAQNNLNRANMVLDESKVLVEDMEQLDQVFQELAERMRKAVSTKDLLEITKAMTDLSRTRGIMIKNFKKLTGQFKETPQVIVDQSTKEVHITTDQEGRSKLAKELAKAEFKSNVKKVEDNSGEKTPTPPEKDNVKVDDSKEVVDAEFKVEEKKEDDTNGKTK